MTASRALPQALLALLALSACVDPGPSLTLSGFALAPADDAIEVHLSDFLVAAPGAEADCENGRQQVALTYAAVEVGPASIRLGDTVELALPGGLLDPDNLQGQNIGELYDALAAMAESTKSVSERGCAESAFPDGFQGRVLFVVHPDAPFSVVRSVMYTAGQAQFGEFNLLVDDPDPVSPADDAAWTGPSPGYGRRGQIPSLGLTAAGLVLFTADGPALVGRCLRSTACSEADDFDWSGVVEALLDLKAVDPTEESLIVVPEPGVAWSTLVRALDVSRSHGGRRLFSSAVIAGGASGRNTRPAPVLTARSGWSRSLPASARIAVHRSVLPAIGPPAEARSDAKPQEGVSRGRDLERRVAEKSSLLAVLGSSVSSAGSGSLGGVFGDAGLAGHAEAPAQASLRQWFPETFLFAPLVQTADDGTATVEVELPDQLTQWRILGLAHDRDGRQAGTVDHLLSTLPAYVEVRPLPALRVGDRVDVPVRVVNHSPDPLVSRLLVRTQGEAMLSTGVALDPHGAQVQAVVVAPEQPGPLRVTATLGSPDHALDQTEQVLDVVPRGRPRIHTVGGVLGSQRTLSLPPASAPLGASSAELVLLPGGLGVLRWELSRIAGRPADTAAERAYVAALASRSASLAAAAGVTTEASELRRLRLEAIQAVVPGARRPSVVDALTLLRGLSGLEMPAAASLSERLVARIVREQSPDGSFAAVLEVSSLDRSLVLAAEAAKACAPHAPAVGEKVRGFLARHVHRIRDAHTAAVVLSSGLVDPAEHGPLLALVRDGIDRRPDGSEVLVPGSRSVRLDGSQPGWVDGTAAAVSALLAVNADVPPGLLDALLSAHDPQHGFGDALAGLSALEALSAALDAPLPEQVAIELRAGELVGLDQTVSLSDRPTVLALPELPHGSDVPWTLTATPPVPGLAFQLTRSDWLVPSTEAGSERLKATVPTEVVLGERFELQVQVAVAEPLELEVSLPAGVDAETDGLLALEGIRAVHAEAGLVRVEVDGRARLLDLRLPLVATLSGSLQWGGVSVAGSGGRADAVSVGIPELVVRR